MAATAAENITKSRCSTTSQIGSRQKRNDHLPVVILLCRNARHSLIIPHLQFVRPIAIELPCIQINLRQVLTPQFHIQRLHI